HSLRPCDRALVSQLRRTGVFTTRLDSLELPGTSSMLEIADQVLAHLPNQTSVEFQGERATASHSIGISSRQLMDYPELFMWGLQPRWLDIVENYLRQPAAYLGCILRREVPNQRQVGVRLWHQDAEDYKVIKVIVYLSDVGVEEGPFEYIPKQQTPAYSQFRHLNNIIRDQDMAQVIPPEVWQQCLGPRSTVVIADTVSVFHHASVPKNDRYSLTLAYTSTKPKSLSRCRQWCPYGQADAWLKIQTMLSPRQRRALIDWR
ncbi:MAG: hypothetical protein AAGA46_15795, partial [Cyanobacteria bacterium P01_F01_bin.13]